MAMETFESGTTIVATWVSSIAPDAPPTLEIRDGAGTLVSTVTATTSGELTAWAAAFATPDLPGTREYVAMWVAIKHYKGEAYTLRERQAFRVHKTGPRG
jgi:hypothetical protein